MTFQTIWTSNALIIALAMFAYYFMEYKAGNVSPFSMSYWTKDNIMNLIFTFTCVFLWYLVLGIPTKMAALVLGLVPNLAVDWLIDIKNKYSKPKA